ncbi:MAG: AzlD domain-containing protein [Ilumatobacter sp.]|nr:AzlD domain-containing protein [Ilumatobacter sp.]
MTTTAAIAVVLIVGAMTYTMRASVIVALANRTIGPRLERSLKMVGPAVLAALAINLAAGGEGGPNLDLAEAAALFAAGVVARWRRSLLWSLAAGMLALWIVSALR